MTLTPVHRALAAGIAAATTIVLAVALHQPYQPSPPGSVPTAVAPTPGSRP